MHKKSGNKVSFKNYIHSYKDIPDNAAGDFVKDAQQDKNLPNVKSWGELEKYLWSQKQTIIDKVCEAAKVVWNDYQMNYLSK